MKTTFTQQNASFKPAGMYKWSTLFIFLMLFLASFSSETQAQNKLWDKTFGGNDYDELRAMVATQDGGYLLAGDSYSDVGGDKSEPKMAGCDEFDGCKNDFWIVRVDANGKKLWDKTLGTTNFGSFTYDNLATVIATSDGGFLLGGTTQYDWYDPNYLVIKIDSNGNTLWTKEFGGTDTDELRAIVATADGGYMLAGSSVSSIGGDKSENNRMGVCDSFMDVCPYDNWIVKIDAKGNKLWDKTIGGTDSDDLATITTTPDGGFLLGGTSGSSKSGDKSEARIGAACDEFGNCPQDYWVVKVDAAGKKVWDKTFGTTRQDKLSALTLSADGSFLLSGTTRSTDAQNKVYSAFWAVKVSKELTKVWEQTFNKEAGAVFSEQVPTSDGGYLLGGSYFKATCEDFSEFCSDDYWVVKINSSGVKQWEKAFNGGAGDKLTAMIATPDGNILLGGKSDSNAGGDKSEAGRGLVDYWVLKVASGVTVAKPKITYFSPGVGLPGVEVTIKGANLHAVTGVNFNGLAAKFTLTKAGIVAVVPAGATSGSIVLDYAAGSVNSAQWFMVLQPKIVKLNPGATKVGSSFYITGTNLATAKAVYINGVAAKSVTVISNMVVKAVVPKGASTGLIKIVLAGGATTTSKRSLKVVKAPAAEIAANNEKVTTAEAAAPVAYPNPFVEGLTIAVTLEQAQPVTILIYNAAGQSIKELAYGRLEAGTHHLNWNGANSQGKAVTEGIYFYKVAVNGKLTTGKILKTDAARR